MSLGDRIHQVRVNLGLNQTEMSKKIGISQNLISLYEKNKNQPSIETLMKIAQMGGITLDWLFTGKDPFPNYSAYTFTMFEGDMIVKDTTPIYYDAKKVEKIEGSWVPVVKQLLTVKDKLLYDVKEISEQIFVPYARSIYFAVVMQDDSMFNPTSNRSAAVGDHAIINPSENAINGDVVLLVTQGRQFVRQLKNKADTITVTAWNQNYPEITFEKTDVKALLRVIAIQPKQIKLL